MHQKILGEVDKWEDLGTGAVVDLVCHDKKIIAEVKNKHNTVTGGKLADQYNSLQRLVEPKHSKFFGYKAYFVNIIPKRAQRTDLPFTPSDRDKGVKCQLNKNIRIIDGASFYTLVTGEENGLKMVFDSIPTVVETLVKSKKELGRLKIPELEKFNEYYYLAFGR